MEDSIREMLETSSRPRLPEKNSSSAKGKPKNPQMGLHPRPQLLHSNGNSRQCEDTAYYLGKVFCQLLF